MSERSPSTGSVATSLKAASSGPSSAGPSRAPRMLDGEQEAHLIALACGSLPAGRRRWTLRLLADKMVEFGHIDTVSHETIRCNAQKNELKPWTVKQLWRIPPDANPEFVWKMEDVLEVYRRPV